MKVLYKKLERKYLDMDFRKDCSSQDIISITRAILNSNFSTDTQSNLIFQFNNDLITIKVLADKLLANSNN